ncbi:MAG: type II secretion system protein N [Hyphomonadaceae bacterium]|nr:type II secretion system protein N [Hyphomonadaceae bacterium]MBC6412850.1 type II secretion system protein N [Hyphomonadaceae bacterium]
MKTILIITVFVIGGLTGLLTQLPLSWVAGSALRWGPTQPVASGTVWKGQITNLPSLQTLRITTRPLSILTPQSLFIFDGQGVGVSLKGEAGLRHIRDVVYSAKLSSIPITDGRLRELAGDVRLTVRSATFGKQCKTLGGRVWTNLLASNTARLNWRGPELSGPVTCEDGTIRVTVSGRDDQTDVNATIDLLPEGNYQSDITVNSRDPAAALVLPLYGFDETSQGFRLAERGRWL